MSRDDWPTVIFMFSKATWPGAAFEVCLRMTLDHSRWGVTNEHGSIVDFQANATPLILPVAWITCCRRVWGNWGT